MKNKVLLLGLMVFMVACSNKSTKTTDNGMQTTDNSQIENKFDPSQMDEQQIKEYQEQAEKALAENAKNMEEMLATMSEEEKANFEKQLEKSGMTLEDITNPEKMLEKAQDPNAFTPESMNLPIIQTGDLDRLAKNEKIANEYKKNISAVKDDISIEGNSGPAPSSVDDLVNTFKLTEIYGIEGPVGQVTEFESPSEKILEVGTSEDGISTIIEPKDKIDITLPYDIDMDDTIKSAREKLIDGAEITYPSENANHLEFVAGNTSFNLTFGQNGNISIFSIGKTADPEAFSQSILTGVYIDKNQKREEGTFEIDGKELTYPLTLGELKEKLGGELEQVNDENFVEFSESININNINNLAYNILKSGDKKYLIEFDPRKEGEDTPDDWLTNPDMDYRVKSIGFLSDIPFSVKNKDIEINEKNYKDLEQSLLDKQIPFMDILGEIVFTMYDNIKFSEKDDFITIKETFYELRLYEEAELRKSNDQAYKANQGVTNK